MSASASAAQARADLSEVLGDSVRQRAAPKAAGKAQGSAQPYAAIEANTFYGIMFAEETKPEEKKAAITRALTFEGTKEEMRARIQEFETFKEYLQHVREEMAQEIIRLTDTEAFSELQQVYGELNNSLLGFNDKMKPLTDIIDAVYTLRKDGKTLDVFQEIQGDRRFEEDYNRQVEEKRAERQNLDGQIAAAENDIARLSEQRGFFGFGGIKEEARVAIALKNKDIDRWKERAAAVEAEVAALDAQKADRSAGTGAYAEQKAKLRELLDISTDQHKERQRALVDSALGFVKTAKDRVGSVRSHLSKMSTQVEGLADANANMSRVYAIMNEGIKAAESENQGKRAALEPPRAEEDMITKIAREEKKGQIEDHIKMLDASAVDTLSTFADLTSQTIRIKTMKEATEGQIQKARQMHSQGIAGVADRLSVVLQAVSSAALGESSSMAKDTLAEMARSTNLVAQKESIRIAMGASETNADLDKALADLAAYGEVQRAATDITREAVTEMRGKLDELQQLAKGVQEDISEAIAVHADVGLGVKGAADRAPAAAGPKSPFKFGA